jgi:hypothetical protein
MTHKKNTPEKENPKKMPDAEEVARELGKATSIDDFYGKEGIFARLFSGLTGTGKTMAAKIIAS